MAPRVSLFLTCSGDLLYPDAGRSVVEVLDHLGVEVDFPESQVCCGQPWLNSGHEDGARIMAEKFIETFSHSTAIVSVSASCVDTIRNRLPGLFPENSPECRAMAEVAGKTYEFAEYLHKVLKYSDPPRHRNPEPTTYHSSCRTLRGVGLTGVAEGYLTSMLGDAFRPLPSAEVCCGFGGSFSVKLPEISGKMMGDKLKNIASTGCSRVVSLDLGCLTHLKGGAARMAMDGVRFTHFAEVLNEALKGVEG